MFSTLKHYVFLYTLCPLRKVSQVNQLLEVPFPAEGSEGCPEGDFSSVDAATMKGHAAVEIFLRLTYSF